MHRRLIAVGVILCASSTLNTAGLSAQQSVPAGVHRSSSLGREAALAASVHPTVRVMSDSGGPDRAQSAVLGAAIGGAVGIVLGYHHGKVDDARCGSECGGPRGIAPVADAFVFGLVGAALGAVVGYAFGRGG